MRITCKANVGQSAILWGSTETTNTTVLPKFPTLTYQLPNEVLRGCLTQNLL